MSKGTEQDQSGQGGATSGAGASADPVWPVWGGGAPMVPAADHEAEDSAAVDEAADEVTPSVASEPTTDPEPAADDADDDSETPTLEADEPATDEVATDELATDEPATDEPAADEPATDEPGAAIHEPAHDEASSDDATSDEVISDEATTDEASNDEPATDEPATDEPATDEPVAESDEVAIDADPVGEARIDEAAIHEPAADEPAAEEPVADEPAADGPVADEPAADEPAAGPDEARVDDPANDEVPNDGTDAGPTDDGAAGDEASLAPVAAAEEPAKADEAPSEPAPVEETVAAAAVAETDEAPADVVRTADVSDEPAEPEPSEVVGEGASVEPTGGPEPVAEAVEDESAQPAPEGEQPAPTDETPVVVAPPAEPEPEVVRPNPFAALASAALASAIRPTAPTVVAPESEPAPAPQSAVVPAAPTEVLPPVAAEPDPVQAPTEVLTPVAAAAVPVVAPTAVTARVEPTPVPARAFAPVSAAAAAASGTIQAGPVPPRERDRDPSPFDVFEPENGRRRWPRRLAIVGGIVLVLGAAYVGASFAEADKVPRGASVAGVDIGGLASADAVARLDDELSGQATKPIPVVAQDTQATLDPKVAGLTLDAQATVDELTGLDLATPKRLWNHLVGVEEQPAVTAVDQTKLAAALDGLGTSVQLEPVDGTIVYVDGTAQSTQAVDGWALDPEGAAKVVTDDWLVAPRPLKLPTKPVEPTITQEETDAALAEATTVSSAPVSVSVDGQVALLDAKTLADNASYVPTDGDLALQLNGEGLTAAVLEKLPTLLTESADAHFEFVNGAPVIVPGASGTTLDPKAIAAAVAKAAVSSNRSATAELVQADPTESTAALEALGIKEVVSKFDTPLTSEPRRTVNITNGASKINGTLIKPGETFSLTEALGPIDAAHGFVEAGAIVSGEHTDAWGGGLSQVSTTSYNAGFLAGFEDIEHKPHSEWFARYPEGRESTIFTGTLDMRWKNNTPYGALVQSWVADNRVYVWVWGTKYWTVESITSPRSNVVHPTTVYSQSRTCEPSSAGNPGFSVTVTRKTSLNGELVKTESDSWRYKPQNKIVCGPAPTPAP
ncbi:VanW family protein [Cellulomonas sp. URHD0024]|uniref:VanW family protein n=1 Tax=Cellulomonas sp. URHD0024 TaxID=1302620 RepID=UPI000423CB4D|nr:VanW family protein [Cellulomonas sp. URHD0024]